MSAELIDSARHKLRLARYHGQALQAILAQSPPDDPENELRIALEAHLEGLAYTGTAAAEKTVRSIDPDTVPEFGSIDNKIDAARRAGLGEDKERLLNSFAGWWQGDGTRYVQAARALRNDAAHTVYRKTRTGPRWRMTIRGHPRGIDLDRFARGYQVELVGLLDLIAEIERTSPAAAGNAPRPNR